jgi:NADH-quinone oxidoreductase subunit E
MSGNTVHHQLFVRENRPVAFSEGTLQKIRQIVKRYPGGQQRSAILPVLHIARQENGGYLTVDAMDQVAELLGLKPIEVYEVATFYSMYFLEKVGKYVIEVCQTAPCAVCGGEELMNHLQRKLGISNGGTTPDGLFTLHGVECLGGCGYAPVLQVNTEFHEQMTKEKADRLIDELREENAKGITRETKWEEEFC